jgi:glucose dehydrogenase
MPANSRLRLWSVASLALLAFPLTMFARDSVASQVSPADWPSYNRTRAGDRYSPLNQITRANAARLRPYARTTPGSRLPSRPAPW